MILADISKKYRRAKKIHLVVDNLSTHSKKALVDHFGEDRGEKLWQRFKLHYTPTHGSWLNQAETEIGIGIGIFVGHYIGKTRVPDIDTLKKKATAWNKESNEKRIKFNWRFTTKKARVWISKKSKN